MSRNRQVATSGPDEVQLAAAIVGMAMVEQAKEMPRVQQVVERHHVQAVRMRTEGGGERMIMHRRQQIEVVERPSAQAQALARVGNALFEAALDSDSD